MLVGDVDEVGDDLRHVGDRRQLVGVERLREDGARSRVEQPLLRERVPEPLDDPALDLARRAERVDHAADVVDRGDRARRDLAGLDVDGDLGDLDAEREHPHAGRFGPRAPLPRICASSSRPATSSSGHEPPSDETICPPLSDEDALSWS